VHPSVKNKINKEIICSTS